MSMNSLQDLFVHQLKDLYSAERQFAEAQPKMAEAASSAELRKAFEEHAAVTREHVERLEQVGKILGVSLGGKTCEAAQGLVAEGRDMLQEDGDQDVRDAGLIAAAQRIEHYEIAGYGTVCTYAEQLGHKDALGLLRKTLDEEKSTDQRLTRLAEGNINRHAQA